MTLALSIEGDGIKRFHQLTKDLGDKATRRVYSRALNDTGNKTATRTGRALADQAGVKRTTGRKAVKKRTRSRPATLEFQIHIRGGAIRYKYFKGTRETRKGVSTAPRGERKLLTRHFINAGWAPTRVHKASWNGHVMTVTGNNKSGVDVARSDVFLPEESIQGDTAETFDEGKSHLDTRVTHHLKRLGKGALS